MNRVEILSDSSDDESTPIPPRQKIEKVEPPVEPEITPKPNPGGLIGM